MRKALSRCTMKKTFSVLQADAAFIKESAFRAKISRSAPTKEKEAARRAGEKDPALNRGPTAKAMVPVTRMKMRQQIPVILEKEKVSTREKANPSPKERMPINEDGTEASPPKERENHQRRQKRMPPPWPSHRRLKPHSIGQILTLKIAGNTQPRMIRGATGMARMQKNIHTKKTGGGTATTLKHLKRRQPRTDNPGRMAEVCSDHSDKKS